MENPTTEAALSKDQEPVNPLLQKLKLPGSRFRLPSKGLFYKNGELAETCENGEVEVFPLTALDEITLNNPDKILNDDGLREILGRAAPAILQPEMLASKDLDSLMCKIYQVTYGNDHKVEYEHDCENAKKHEYTVDLGHILAKTVDIDPTTKDSIFNFELPNGQKVMFTPTKVNQTMKLNSMFSKTDMPSLEEFQLKILESVINNINYVDNIKDKEMIFEWLKQLRADWLKDLVEKIEGTNYWGSKIEQEIICKDCGKKVTMPVNINPINFFLQ